MVSDLINKSLETVNSLKLCSSQSMAARDYSGSQQLDALVGRLKKATTRMSESLKAFSLVDCPDGVFWDSAVEDRLDSEGSEFFDANFLFQYTDVMDGQSIGSLAIIAGAGMILTDIRNNWEGLSVLSSSMVFPQSDRGPGATANSDNLYSSNQSRGPAIITLGSGGVKGSIDFTDARELRDMGYGVQDLKRAGFSDVDILVSLKTSLQ